MKQPDIVKYSDLMEEVKRRMTVIDAFRNGLTHAVYVPTTSESIVLQIRKILELVAMDSLVANKHEFSKVYSEFAKYWNAELLLRDLERINSEFYPKPIIEQLSASLTYGKRLLAKGNVVCDHLRVWARPVRARLNQHSNTPVLHYSG